MLRRLLLPIVSRLLRPILAPCRAVSALLQLPTSLGQWTITLREHSLLLRESNDLFRELILALGHGPVQTPETPHVPLWPPTSRSSSGLEGASLSATPSASKDPRRLRTDRDVTYSSRTFLRAQDERAAAEQRPWHQPDRR